MIGCKTLTAKSKEFETDIADAALARNISVSAQLSALSLLEYVEVCDR